MEVMVQWFAHSPPNLVDAGSNLDGKVKDDLKLKKIVTEPGQILS